MPNTRSSRKLQRGAAALEFAIMAPILIMLVFGVVDFGLMFNAQAVFANATRDAARSGSFSAAEAEIVEVVESETSYLPNSSIAEIEVACKTPAGATCTNYDTQRESGGVVMITVTFEHKWLTPSLLALPNVTTVVKKSEMRIE